MTASTNSHFIICCQVLLILVSAGTDTCVIGNLGMGLYFYSVSGISEKPSSKGNLAKAFSKIHSITDEVCPVAALHPRVAFLLLFTI